MAGEGKNKTTINKEDDSDNWCFVCKDGGDLRICDFRQCPKSYHPRCVGKKDSFLDSDKEWDCPWHKCYRCVKSSYLRCYTCSKATCSSCLPASRILKVKGEYGFCKDCLKLALLIEENKECDSDGDHVDFTDGNTEEGLFMEYYTITKDKEGFKLTDLYAAKERVSVKKLTDLSAAKECVSVTNLTDLYAAKELISVKNLADLYAAKERVSVKQNDPPKSSSEDFDQESDSSAKKVEKSKTQKRQRKSSGQKPEKLNKKVIIEGDKAGPSNAADKVSAHKRQRKADVEKVNEVKEAVKINEVKEAVIEAVPIESRLAPKSTSENFDQEPDSSAKKVEKSKPQKRQRKSSEQKPEKRNKKVSFEGDKAGPSNAAGKVSARKRQRKADVEKINEEKEAVKINEVKEAVIEAVPIERRLASIEVENIKLLYLRRSVLKEMLEELESFEEKAVGCFVQLRRTYQLIRIKGVKTLSPDETKTVLLLSEEPTEMIISKLADTDPNDVSERGEFNPLMRKFLAGEIERPTVGYIQEKATSLHKHRTTVMIRGRLSVLSHRIQQCREKRLKDDEKDYQNEKTTLESEWKKARLLHDVPTVIPDMSEPVADLKSDKGSSTPVQDSDDRQNNNKSEEDDPDMSKPVTDLNSDKVSSTPVQDDSVDCQNNNKPEEDDPDMSNKPVADLKSDKGSSTPVQDDSVDRQNNNKPEENDQLGLNTSALEQIEPSPAVEVEACRVPESEGRKIEDEGNNINEDLWAKGPSGERIKVSLCVLRKWCAEAPYFRNFLVWKEGQREEDAVLLPELLATPPAKGS